MKTGHKTHYETVALINGRARYINSLSELPENTLVADVKVITNKGKETARDQVIADDQWVTVKEYRTKK